jgi:hypothetical protein
MYSPPSDLSVERAMLGTFDAAAAALGAAPDGPPVWGWHGRTLSRSAAHPVHGACWLRLLAAPAEKAGGKLWEGTAAAAVFDGRVNKPALHAVHDRVEGAMAYRAELTAFVDAPACSPSPVLRAPLKLPGIWWKSLRTDLEALADAATDRVAVRQQWIDRAVPEYTGYPAPRVSAWATAHGDLHLANITTTGVLLDWEGWGLAPAGYDAALLLAYSLLEPATAARIRAEFAGVLDSGSGRAAQLVVAAELLQSVSRGDHPELAGPLRAMAGVAAA